MQNKGQEGYRKRCIVSCEMQFIYYAILEHEEPHTQNCFQYTTSECLYMHLQKKNITNEYEKQLLTGKNFQSTKYNKPIGTFVKHKKIHI